MNNTNEKLQEIIDAFTPELEAEYTELKKLSYSKTITWEQGARFRALVHLKDAGRSARRALKLEPDTENEEKADENYAEQAFKLHAAYLERK